MSTSIPHIITTESATAFFSSGPVVVSSNSPNFNDFIKAINADDAAEALMLSNPEAAFNQRFRDYEMMEVKDGIAYLDDEALNELNTEHLLDLVERKVDLNPTISFMRRLRNNPSARAVEGLLKFLRANQMPITNTGSFMAYKRINDNWTDCHTGKIDNSVGSVVTMKRNKVNDDPRETCSHGLHVCGHSYLQHFGGARLIAVMIDPADVVAIPTDYNAAKMRVCRYTVLRELPMPEGFSNPRDTLRGSNFDETSLETAENIPRVYWSDVSHIVRDSVDDEGDIPQHRMIEIIQNANSELSETDAEEILDQWVEDDHVDHSANSGYYELV